MGAIKRCLVVCAAALSDAVTARREYLDFAPDLVIAADGGYLHCDALGITPNIILGDFDSAPRPTRTDAIVYPAHKDDTDCMLALREGILQGATEFLLLGCTGGRLDHTIGVIHSLAWLRSNGASGMVLDEQHTLRLLCGGEELTLPFGCSYLSLLAMGECEGVTITGVEYPLDNHTLTDDFPLGVSNKITADHCRITLTRGKLLVITVL